MAVVLVAAELAVIFGALAAAALISQWPGSTAKISWSLIGSIIILALPVVNFFALVIFLPLKLTRKIKTDKRGFIWRGTIFGGVIYVLISAIIAAFHGLSVLLQFFGTGAFLFPMAMGAGFSALFCAFFFGLQKWIIRSHDSA